VSITRIHSQAAELNVRRRVSQLAVIMMTVPASAMTMNTFSHSLSVSRTLAPRKILRAPRLLEKRCAGPMAVTFAPRANAWTARMNG
ncbi:hypothetical protein FS837_004278, partial [Tulasnella sp. UAMH 9824]